MFQKAKNFLKEVRVEMSRVNWPSREELRSSTAVVIMVTLAFAVFIFFVDNIFKHLFNLLY
ncbi:preprotein translocase subunit SecE [candidate division KSB1 bacterium]|nr:preprotein translocase subunit SecE [bacterium]OQX57696.1 MAG: preprotein translocase subunit SecE [candidate division KSB1 bacterium 4484_219]RKY77317.1 MAG: preprotein translocase subunit SecE [candidate division KSB1 bacterium]HDI52135.1 preprotein translocase subunit SecE [Bacteroidota bacterium]RKY77420.1 MAG: preprotein translocase subunit SecE [candidate division KSB1 bacterium]